MARRKKRSKKRRQKGIWSKVGAFLIGGVPPIASGLEAVAYASHPSRSAMSMMDKITLGVTRFANNLTAGFTGLNVFDKITLAGQAAPYTVGNAWKNAEGGQGYPWLVTTLTGLGAMAVDKIAGYLSGSGNRIAGITLTGSK